MGFAHCTRGNIESKPSGTLIHQLIVGYIKITRKVLDITMSNTIIGPEKHVQSLTNEISKIHGSFTTLEEADFYPEHDKRKESSEYEKVHKKMILEDNIPCMVCGVTHEQLSDPVKRKDSTINPYSAKQLETHHHIVEWSLANAIDPTKFNNTVRIHLMNEHQDNPLYKNEMSEQDILDWIDHGADNLWVLCDVHHRHKYFGIHHVTYPNWAPQNLYTKEFLQEVEDKISQNKK